MADLRGRERVLLLRLGFEADLMSSLACCVRLRVRGALFDMVEVETDCCETNEVRQFDCCVSTCRALTYHYSLLASGIVQEYRRIVSGKNQIRRIFKSKEPADNNEQPSINGTASVCCCCA